MEIIDEIGLERKYSIFTAEILKELKWDSSDDKEKLKNSQKLGRILKKLGIKVSKLSEGRQIVLNEYNRKTIKRLFKRYEISM